MDMLEMKQLQEFKRLSTNFVQFFTKKGYGNLSMTLDAGRNFDYELGINFITNSGIIDSDTYDSIKEMIGMEVAGLEITLDYHMDEDDDMRPVFNHLLEFFKQEHKRLGGY